MLRWRWTKMLGHLLSLPELRHISRLSSKQITRSFIFSSLLLMSLLFTLYVHVFYILFETGKITSIENMIYCLHILSPSVRQHILGSLHYLFSSGITKTT